MKTLIESLKESINPILEVRDFLGAEKHKTYLLTREWTGELVGEGIPSDSIEIFNPSPNLVDVTLNHRTREGGKVREGDLMLKMISKQTFPKRSLIDGTSTGDKQEKFYYINEELYQIIQVTEDHLWWNVTVRKNLSSKVYF